MVAPNDDINKTNNSIDVCKTVGDTFRNCILTQTYCRKHGSLMFIIAMLYAKILLLSSVIFHMMYYIVIQ